MRNRRSTAHDLASLRLHPDGTRVASREPEASGLKLDRRRKSGRWKNSTKDLNGNWIAQDAGGSGLVKIYESTEPEQEDATEHKSAYHGTGWRHLPRSDDTVVSEGLSSPERTTSKRRKVNPVPPFVNATAEHHFVRPDIMPSSDLLKCILHLASRHYAMQGQLSGRSRRSRQSHNISEVSVQKARSISDGDDDNSSSIASPSDQDSAREFSDAEDETEDELPDEKAEGVGADNAPQRDAVVRRDMYRRLDGSSLVAIGLLLQTHIIKLTEGMIPEGWEDEMAAEGDRHKIGGRKRKRHNISISNHEGHAGVP